MRTIPLVGAFGGLLMAGMLGFMGSQLLESRSQLESLDRRLSALERELRAGLPDRIVDAAQPAAAEPAVVSIQGAPLRGAEDAAVTIVAFSDFQCPYCSRAHPTLTKLLDQYPGQVRIAFRHLPLAFHADARLAHRAAIASGRQGRFWEMHDRIFENSRSLDRDSLLDHARALGLDMQKFNDDLESEAVAAEIERDIEEAERLGVTGTPTFFVNATRVAGAQPYANFQTIVDRELARTGS